MWLTHVIVVVQSPRRVWLFVTSQAAAFQVSLSLTIPGVCPRSCPVNWWFHPAISSSVIPFSSCPQSFPASGSFPVSALCIRWPKYWSFSFNISFFSEHSRLISIRIDWFDLLAVKGTLDSFLQHHSSKASILWCLAFFMVQLSHPCTTTEKNYCFD